ncbi:hypothetical protein bcere0009_20790 [Bacillus cereus R309803]|nr:hypothetical protein bcere0009_20790 [Bacillus cereus R309803]
MMNKEKRKKSYEEAASFILAAEPQGKGEKIGYSKNQQ